MRTPGADQLGIDALRTDLYVESLLDAAGPHAVADAAGSNVDPAVADAAGSNVDPAVADAAGSNADPDVADAARVLRVALGRAHPSFRFEERLSRRLADLALAMRRAAAVAGRPATAIPDTAGRRAVMASAGDGRPAGDVIAFPVSAVGAAFGLEPDLVGRADLRPALAGSVVASAAIASAALSIGAAALVAWRRTHLRGGIG